MVRKQLNFYRNINIKMESESVKSCPECKGKINKDGKPIDEKVKIF